MFKCQLQEVCQKAGLEAPVYNVKKEGPSHEPQFKASVTVQGVSYESPISFASLKKAEHAAAEVALQAIAKSNSTSVGSLHESGLCKNLLQEYAQKRRMTLPIYSVEKTDGVPSASFIASVEVGGVQYRGESCKSKKEAEIKAARAALVAIYAESGASLQGLDKQEPEGSLKEEPMSVKVKPVESATGHGECNSKVERNVVKEEPAKEETPTPIATGVKNESSPLQPLLGSKRKRRLVGGNRGRKAKVKEGQVSKDEEPVDEDVTEQSSQSSSLLIGGGNGIPGITAPLAKGEQPAEA